MRELLSRARLAWRVLCGEHVCATYTAMWSYAHSSVGGYRPTTTNTHLTVGVTPWKNAGR